MKPFFIFLCAMYLIADEISAQTYSFLVKNLNEKKALEYAHIQLGNSHFGAVTDINGYANFTLPGNQKDSIIYVSHIGYGKVSIDLRHLETSKVNEVFLQVSDLEIAEFSIVDLDLSPYEFYSRAVNLVNDTFYSKNYSGLCEYEERVMEDGRETFSYNMDIVLVSNGFSAAKGKNIYISNDDAYFVEMNYFKGAQHYTLLKVAEMLDYRFKYDPPKFDQDNNLTLFFLEYKSSIERQTFLIPNLKDGDQWYFEDILEIGDESYAKVTYSKTGSKASFLISIKDYSIHTIWFNISDSDRNFQNDMERYTHGSLNGRIDYFKVDGKSKLKQFELISHRHISKDGIQLGEKRIFSTLTMKNLYQRIPKRRDKIDLYFIDKFYK